MSVIMLGLTVAVIPVSAAGGAISTLSVEAVNGNDKTAVNWWYNSKDRKYYLFLPSDADLNNLTVNISGSDSFTVGKTTVQSGETTDAFAAGGTFTVTSGGSSYTLVVMKSQYIPAIYIQTESGSLSYIHKNKNNKEPGTITVVENGKVTVDNSKLNSIKGRGNATWGLAKKPYNIKFDKKTDLFGMGKAKKWSLLANHLDSSLIRNNLALGMAQDLGLPYSSECHPVDLYINGEYLGNYLVCESVEVKENRIDINNLEDANEEANPGIDIEACKPVGNGVNGAIQKGTVKGARKWVEIPNDPQNIKDGYLLELEFNNRIDEEVSGFTTNVGQSVTIKSPEYASKAEVNYIADLWQEVEDAVYSETGYNSLGKHYSEYFDMDSVTEIYILQEYTMCLDAGQSSCFFFKDGDKFYGGPAWDYDHSMIDSQRFGISLSDPSVWYANACFYTNKIYSCNYLPSIFNALYRHEDFRDAVEKKWREVSSVFGDNKVAQVKALAETTSASAVMNGFRWNLISGSTAKDKLNTYFKLTNDIANFVPARRTALTKGFSANTAMLYYDANGGDGIITNDKIVSIGEKVTLKGTTIHDSQMTSPDENLEFIGWNTKPDGRGTHYAEGDSVKLTKRTTVLYAQWKDASNCSHLCHNHKSKFVEFIWRILNFYNRIFKINRFCGCGAKHW